MTRKWTRACCACAFLNLNMCAPSVERKRIRAYVCLRFFPTKLSYINRMINQTKIFKIGTASAHARKHIIISIQTDTFPIHKMSRFLSNVAYTNAQFSYNHAPMQLSQKHVKCTLFVWFKDLQSKHTSHYARVA